MKFKGSISLASFEDCSHLLLAVELFYLASHFVEHVDFFVNKQLVIMHAELAVRSSGSHVPHELLQLSSLVFDSFGEIFRKVNIAALLNILKIMSNCE